MGKVIFSKFSSERKTEYRIVTEIIRENNGNQAVLKKALTREAAEHIKRIPDNMTRLKTYYKDDRLAVAPCRTLDDRTVEFQYIDGVRYDQYIEDIISRGDYDRLKDELVKLKEIMTNVSELTKFHISAPFTEVFGEHDYSLLNGKESFVVSNVDMIFGNIIKKENILYITDYEWVFDFFVPVNYVIYRSLLLSSAMSMLEAGKRKEIYELLSVTEEEISIYNKMEEGFQNYVSDRNMFDDYKSKSSNRVFRFRDIAENVTVRYINVYSVSSDGDRKNLYHMDFSGNVAAVNQKLYGTEDKVVFQLGSDGAVIKIKEIFAYRGNDRITDIPAVTDAELIIGDDYYFKGKNPHITVENDNYDSVGIELIIYYDNTTLIGNYIDKINECTRVSMDFAESERKLILKDGDISYRDEMIAALNQKLENAEKEIEQMKKTFVWRTYTKLKRKKSNP